MYLRNPRVDLKRQKKESWNLKTAQWKLTSLDNRNKNFCVPEKEEKEKGEQSIPEEIMGENIPNLMKDMKINSQEA